MVFSSSVFAFAPYMLANHDFASGSAWNEHGMETRDACYADIGNSYTEQ